MRVTHTTPFFDTFPLLSHALALITISTVEGNSPDASGRYPGEPFYKDPMRGDVSFAIMMAERAEADARKAAPKAGEAPGCKGCRT